MIDFKPNNGGLAIGTKTGIDKIVIGKAVLNEKPIKEFIERMRASEYEVKETETGITITGDNMVEAELDDLKKHIPIYTPILELLLTDHEKRVLREIEQI